MEEEFTNFPESFRQEIFARILKAVGRSESVTVLAPPGMGKTLTMQLLAKKIPGSLYLDLNSPWEKNLPTNKPMVIILDHAENFSEQLYFKSIREVLRDKIVFVFAISGNTIPDGPLKSVLLENIFYLEPLNEADAKTFLAKAEKLYKGKLTPAQKKKIVELSGGVPRLIKRLGKLFIDSLDPTSDLKLQNDLGEINKYLAANPQANWSVPLLTKPEVKTESVGKIRFSQNLSKQEYLLAKLLIDNEGQLVTREKMIEVVWQSKMYDVAEHALDQMLHRLRQKLESATPKCKLVTYRGRGCKLGI